MAAELLLELARLVDVPPTWTVPLMGGTQGAVDGCSERERGSDWGNSNEAAFARRGSNRRRQPPVTTVTVETR